MLTQEWKGASKILAKSPLYSGSRLKSWWPPCSWAASMTVPATSWVFGFPCSVVVLAHPVTLLPPSCLGSWVRNLQFSVKVDVFLRALAGEIVYIWIPVKLTLQGDHRIWDGSFQRGAWPAAFTWCPVPLLGDRMLNTTKVSAGQPGREG